MFPEEPTYWGEWVAGLLDADGSVSKTGQVVFYQKPHGGLDRLVEVLSQMGVGHTQRKRPDRNLERVYIRKGSLDVFRGAVAPRFSPKRQRLSAWPRSAETPQTGG